MIDLTLNLSKGLSVCNNLKAVITTACEIFDEISMIDLIILTLSEGHRAKLDWQTPLCYMSVIYVKTVQLP